MSVFDAPRRRRRDEDIMREAVDFTCQISLKELAYP